MIFQKKYERAMQWMKQKGRADSHELEVPGQKTEDNPENSEEEKEQLLEDIELEKGDKKAIFLSAALVFLPFFLILFVLFIIILLLIQYL